MQIIYKNSLTPNALQLTMLPLWFFNIVGIAPCVDMVKNNNYFNHPYILLFIIIPFLALLLTPKTITITSNYINITYSFLCFFKKRINIKNIIKVDHFPNEKNQNFSSIRIKTHEKDITLNIGNYFVCSCSIPELQHANIAQSLAFISQLNVNTTNYEPPIIKGYFYSHNTSKRPTLKNSRYRFVLACGFLTVLSAIFLLSGKAYFPALKFDDHLIFIFSIFTISALIAFLLIKENPKDEYVSNHFTAILFGLMMTLTAYSFFINYTVMYGQAKLVKYELMQNTENNQEWHPINSNDSPIISTPFRSKKTLHSKQEIQIYTGLLGIQTTTFKDYQGLTSNGN